MRMRMKRDGREKATTNKQINNQTQTARPRIKLLLIRSYILGYDKKVMKHRVTHNLNSFNCCWLFFIHLVCTVLLSLIHLASVGQV